MTGKIIQIPRLYPIADWRSARLSLAGQVEAMTHGGARLVQVRDKKRPARDFYEDARRALEIAWGNGARLIVNDRVDIALAIGADGVHLGQEDLPPAAARRLLGERAIVGFSTHNVEQALEASRWPISYLAIGPVFATSSKLNPDPVVGLDGVRRVRERVGDLPLVAIGGIDLENAASVIAAGAAGVAVIGALLADEVAEGVAARTVDFLAALGGR